MKQYLDTLQYILDNGERRQNRTGIDTIGVFGHQARFDLRNGFPLLTTKRVFFRGIVAELLWFLDGDTNAKTLQEQGIHIWDEWATAEQCSKFGREEGDLGPVYGRQFRRVVRSGWVVPQTFDAEPDLTETPYTKNIVISTECHATNLLGRVIESESSGPYTVIREMPPETSPKARSSFRIKFHRTGAERVVDYARAADGHVADLWSKTVFGVGRYGDYDETDPHCGILLDVWREMLRRCYHEGSDSYKSYGAVGVHVAPEWLTFHNFQKDAKTIPNWHLKLDYSHEYSIDKDVLCASNRYSAATCMWATKEEQSLNTSTARPFEAISPSGETVLFRSFGEASRLHGLNVSAVHRCLNGKLRTHHGWRDFRYVERDGLVLRTEIADPLKSLVSDIKHSPMSRRHVITLWNPLDANVVTLPPCHGIAIQFYVQGDALSCHMYQRSCDAFLGAPWNIASYALLTHLVARATGLRVGELIISFGDLHIYSNHIDQVHVQLARDCRSLPWLYFAEDAPTDIFDVRNEHIHIRNYDPHQAIKAEVAV